MQSHPLLPTAASTSIAGPTLVTDTNVGNDFNVNDTADCEPALSFPTFSILTTPIYARPATTGPVRVTVTMRSAPGFVSTKFPLGSVGFSAPTGTVVVVVGSTAEAWTEITFVALKAKVARTNTVLREMKWLAVFMMHILLKRNR